MSIYSKNIRTRNRWMVISKKEFIRVDNFINENGIQDDYDERAIEIINAVKEKGEITDRQSKFLVNYYISINGLNYLMYIVNHLL